MHFPNVAEAVRYLRSEEGGCLHIQHTQVTRAAKANATWDGYAFTFDEPSSLVVASPPRSQRTAAGPAPNLSSFGFTAVQCACCGANICGTEQTCSRCHRVVDEACNLWKDWYNVFHVLVVHVGTSWHPTLLNVMLCTHQMPLNHLQTAILKLLGGPWIGLDGPSGHYVGPPGHSSTCIVTK